MSTIASIRAREILDSRGNPTLEVDVHLSDGAHGRAAMPSGASTGSREAVELRDGDPSRYGGKGVRRAAGNVNEVIGPEIRGADASNQADVDERLRALDGTENKARLGANAILGASLAVARAAAASAGVPLFRRLAPVLAEDDWDGWRPLTERLGGRIQLVGDDIFVTNPAIIRRAIAEGIGDAALIKLNQIGTVSETLEAIAIAKEAGYGVVVSHRSGETADDFTADLAGATAAGQLKSGAPARGTALGGFRRHAGSPRPGDPSPG